MANLNSISNQELCEIDQISQRPSYERFVGKNLIAKLSNKNSRIKELDYLSIKDININWDKIIAIYQETIANPNNICKADNNITVGELAWEILSLITRCHPVYDLQAPDLPVNQTNADTNTLRTKLKNLLTASIDIFPTDKKPSANQIVATCTDEQSSPTPHYPNQVTSSNTAKKYGLPEATTNKNSLIDHIGRVSKEFRDSLATLRDQYNSICEDNKSFDGSNHDNADHGYKQFTKAHLKEIKALETLLKFINEEKKVNPYLYISEDFKLFSELTKERDQLKAQKAKLIQAQKMIPDDMNKKLKALQDAINKAYQHAKNLPDWTNDL
ncbi:MAG: hypothetical protein JW841_08600 [Deltaproteobacteria bacterium]|nr:hypothetical protein [Deltaproteobacteria bacterium]